MAPITITDGAANDALPSQQLKIRIRIPERVHSDETALEASSATPRFNSHNHTNGANATSELNVAHNIARPTESKSDQTHCLSRIDYSASFHVSVECTSLTLSSTGQRHCIIAGFADGTVRLFDLSEPAAVAAASTTMPVDYSAKSKTKLCVGGVIAARICAKGVHTALRLHVATTASWAFAGAVRGSTELLAICLDRDRTTSSALAPDQKLAVFRHSDAKLRGFGACHKLEHSETYLLLTGKAIKNIHIWSFQPNASTDAGAELQPLWQCLYDCPTNGNTIKWLHFRRSYDTTDTSKTVLQAISKSDGQKLRVWDLCMEDRAREVTTTSTLHHSRPTRPPFYDVPNTESALSVAGNLVICGGTVWFNQMSIVSLDTLASSHQGSSPLYNHTELALPGVVHMDSQPRRQRTQRGDVQCVVEAAGTEGYVLVQLSDGSLAAYQPSQSSQVVVPLAHIATLPTGHVRQFQVHHVTMEQRTLCTVATMAIFNPFTGRGRISLQTLQDSPTDESKSASGSPRMTLQPIRVSQTPQISSTQNVAHLSQSKASALVTTIKKRPPTSIGKTIRSEPSIAIVTTAKKKTATMAATPSVIRGGSTMIHPTPEVRTTTVQSTTIPTVSSAQFLRRLPSAETTTKKVSSKDVSMTPIRGSDVAARVLKPSGLTSLSPLPKPRTAQVDSSLPAAAHSKSIEKRDPKAQHQRPVEHVKCSKSLDDGKVTVKPSGVVKCAALPVVKGLPSSRSLVAHTSAPDLDLTAIPRKRPASTQPLEATGSVSLGVDTKAPEKRRRLSLKSKDRGGSNTTHERLVTVKAITPWAAERLFELDTPPSGPKRRTSLSSVTSTTVANETNERIRAACVAKLQELQTLEATVPRLGFWERRAAQSDFLANCLDRHDLDRFRLGSQHRAVHEVLRKRIIDAARRAIWYIYDSPLVSSLEKAKRVLTGSLQVFRDEINAIIQHQKLEAETLDAMQRRDVKDGARMSDVVFSFPLIFEDVLRCLPEVD